MNVTPELIQVAKDVVASKPDDFKYSDGNIICYYAPMTGETDAQAQTGCLVGEILKIYNPDYYNKIRYCAGTFGTLPDVLLEFEKFEDRDFLQALQSLQDGGETWKLSLEKTLEECEMHHSQGVKFQK